MTSPDQLRFNISIISIFVILVAAGVRAWISYHVAGVDALTPDEICWFSGNVLGGAVLLPFFFAWVAWLAFARSSLAANIVFIGLSCVFSLWMWNSASLVWNKEDLFKTGQDTIEEAQRNLSSGFRQALTDPNTPPSTAIEQLNRFSESMTKVANQSGGREKRAGEASARFYKQLTEKMQNYSATTQALSQAGFSRAKGITNKQDLDNRRALVKAFGAANSEVSNFYTNAEKTFRRE